MNVAQQLKNLLGIRPGINKMIENADIEGLAEALKNPSNTNDVIKRLQARKPIVEALVQLEDPRGIAPLEEQLSDLDSLTNTLKEMEEMRLSVLREPNYRADHEATKQVIRSLRAQINEALHTLKNITPS